MSTRIGTCVVASNGLGKGMRIEVDLGFQRLEGPLELNEDQARALLRDLPAAIMIAWPEPETPKTRPNE